MVNNMNIEDKENKTYMWNKIQAFFQIPQERREILEAEYNLHGTGVLYAFLPRSNQ